MQVFGCDLDTIEEEMKPLHDAAKREALNVRKNVGICDVTSLGKIDIKGKDYC